MKRLLETRPAMRRGAGWSLPELLIAIALSMTLATMALRAYLTAVELRAEVDAELRLRDSARFAFQVFGEQLRLAGFPGCLGGSAEFSPLDAAWSPPMPFDAVAGWDELQPHPEQAHELGGDILALWWSVAGCGADPSPYLRAPPAAGQALRGSLFYIGRRGNSAANPPALFMRGLSNFGETSAARELVEGLESLRFRYHESGAAAAQPANQVSDWGDITGVTVELRFRSSAAPAVAGEFSHGFTVRNRPLGAADFPDPPLGPAPGSPGSP